MASFSSTSVPSTYQAASGSPQQQPLTCSPPGFPPLTPTCSSNLTTAIFLTGSEHPGFYRPLPFDNSFYLLNTFPIPIYTHVVVTPIAAYNTFPDQPFAPLSSSTPSSVSYTPGDVSETSAEEPSLGSNGTHVGTESTQDVGNAFENVAFVSVLDSVQKPSKEKKTRLQDTPRYRYKQDLIENTMTELHSLFEGRVLPEKEALRGATTIRLHVKTETAIRSIVDCMTQVTNIPGVLVTQLSTPVSMKNRYQKKGFLCYFRISDVDMVEEVLHHVRTNFACFDRCKVAVPRHSLARSTHKPVRIPTRMAPQVSCEAA